jgi:predicted nucleotidyltransferase
MDEKKTKNIKPFIINLVQSYVEKIISHIPNSKVILFGSYAKGNFCKDSDIDIAVFLPSSYSSDDIVEINRLLCKISGNYDADIQTQVFLQNELINPMGIVEEVVQYGIDITSISKNKLVDFLYKNDVKLSTENNLS